MELYEIIFEEIGLDANRAGHTAKKFPCPGCGKKRFVRYINHKTNEYLPEIYGRCDREQGCAYLLSPYEDIKEAKRLYRENNGVKYQPAERVYEPPPAPTKERKTCTRELMLQTHRDYHRQPLYLWFCSKFGKVTATDIFRTYNVGTAKDGGTLFWQVDCTLQVRTCQKIIYRGFNRDKEVEFGTQRLFKVSEDYEPCLFGEHLLHIARVKGINPLVCIVESEKTAMIGQLYLPTIETKSGERPAVWLACCGANGLTDAKISILKDYDVILFPDYSYLNRAQWGLLPMRKSRREFKVGDKIVNRLVPDPNGEEDRSYVPAKERILYQAKAKSCIVFDAAPEQHDGGDIGDTLVNSGMPIVVPNEPDYNRLKVLVLQREKVGENGESIPAVYGNPEEVLPGMQGYEKQELDKMVFTNPILGTLITTLNLQVDFVEPI